MRTDRPAILAMFRDANLASSDGADAEYIIGEKRLIYSAADALTRQSRVSIRILRQFGQLGDHDSIQQESGYTQGQE